jgi:hypothetical protein
LLPENSATNRSGSGRPASEIAGEPQARGPAFRALVQQRGPRLRQGDARSLQELAGLALRETQIRGTDLGQVAGQAQLVQP